MTQQRIGNLLKEFELLKGVIHHSQDERKIKDATKRQSKIADELKELGVDAGPLSIAPPPFGWNGCDTGNGSDIWDRMKEEDDEWTRQAKRQGMHGCVHDRQVYELWRALAITAVVMCLMGLVLLYRTL